MSRPTLTEAGRTKRITVEAQICAGCRNCELACSYAKTGSYRPSASRVTVLKDDAIGMDYPVVCHQCGECTASLACPSGAFTRSLEGIAKVDHGDCTGCGACAKACRYGAVNMQGATPLVCDLCGGNPACVTKCPTGALSYREAEGEPPTPVEEHAALMRRWGIHA